MRSFGILHRDIGHYPLEYMNSNRTTGITDTVLSTRLYFVKR